MDQTQKDLVRASFAQIAPISDQAGALFYEKLFALDPDLRRLFKTDIAKQAAKLMAALAVVVARLDRLDDVLPTVRDLGRRHVAYGVQDSHYETVGAALITTLEAAFGDAFTLALREAWIACYLTVAGEMKAASAAVRPLARNGTSPVARRDDGAAARAI